MTRNPERKAAIVCTYGCKHPAACKVFGGCIGSAVMGRTAIQSKQHLNGEG